MSIQPLDDSAAREQVRGPETVTGPLTGDGPFDADSCMVVRAGAGSGKTRALVERMVALVRTGIPLRNMAAITFTVRAASEMRARFYSRLQETVGEIEALLEKQPDAQLAEERNRVLDAFGNTDDLFADTIHAFCRTMLAERPFEAGVPPDFRQVDDREEAEMRGGFWHGYLDHAMKDGPRGPAWWAETGVDPSDLDQFFGERCTHEDLVLADGRSERPELDAAVSAVAIWLDQVLAATPDPDADCDRLTGTLHRMNRYRRLMDMESSGGKVEFLQMLDGLVGDEGELKSGVLGVTKWRVVGGATELLMESLRGKADEPAVEPLGDFVLRAVRPTVSRWREYLYGEIRDFVDGAVAEYRTYRCTEGLLTFQDLLLRAADMLRSSSEARRHFRNRYTHLLVDEFQDTDPVQAEVVFLLTSSDEELRDWTRARAVPGSLFLVGDDKQSIYRFRRADVQVFRRACGLIEEAGGHSLPFVTNFRSESRICDWINGALSPAFSDTEPYQAPWEDLRPYEGPGTADDPVLALDLKKEDRNYGRPIARQEAGHLVALVQHLIDGRAIPTSSGKPVRLSPEGVEPGDIMILVRQSTHAAEYTRAFDAAGIPYVVSGGKSLGREPVVGAVLDLLEAALDPDNPVALLAVLRGSLVGASDDELRQFRAAGGTFSFDSPDQPPSTSEAFVAVRDGFRLVERARQLFETFAVGEAMTRLLDREGLLAGMAIRGNGSSSAGALMRLLGIARDIDEKGGGWIEMMDEMRRLVAGEIKAEAQTLEAGGSAVRLLTIHQAKGLQARVVFLAFPLSAKNHTVAFHVDRSEDEPRLYLPCRNGHSEIARPVGWTDAENEARRFEAAEENRLVYVAATRAKELLVVSRYLPKPEGPWAPLYPALGGVPTIDLSGISDIAPDPAGVSMHHGTAMRSFQETQDALTEARVPTFAHESVTGAAKDDDSRSDPFAVETEGLGRGFGRAVHRLFQHAIESRAVLPDPSVMASLAERLVLEETGSRSADMTGRAVEALDAFMKGPVWGDIAASDRVLCESPFVRRVEDGDVPTLVSGVIDVLYRTDAGWVVLDFKTESADADALRNRHAAQIEAYRTHWSELTGEKVAGSLIWPAVPGASNAIDCTGYGNS